MTYVGSLYLNGQGVAKDQDQAIAWYRKAAAGGYLPALSVLTGFAAAPGADPELGAEVLDRWLDAAEMTGAPMPERVVGELILNGVGVEAAPDEAAVWLRRAADQGDAQASQALAGALLQNLAEPSDPGEAVRRLRHAADAGLADAQHNLAVCHHQGIGVEASAAQAERWWRAAAAQDQRRSQVALAELLLARNDAGGVAEAARWLSEAAKAGYGPALLGLARLHETGRGVEQDLAWARQYYQRAADLGLAEGEAGRDRLAETALQAAGAQS